MITIVLTVILICLYFLTEIKDKGLPPGPWGLPIVGYIPFINFFNPLKTFDALAKKYGKLFCLKLGENNVVFICDPRLLKEAFSKPELCGRPSNELLNVFTFGSTFGFSNTSGDLAMENRRFTLRYLKDSGMGKTEFEPIIMKSVNKVLERMRKVVGDPNATLGIYLESEMVNVIWGIMLGHEFNIEDEVIECVIREKLKAFEKYANLLTLSNCNKFVRKFMPGLFYGYDEMFDASCIFKLYAGLVCDYLENFRTYEKPSMYAETFLHRKFEDKHVENNQFHDRENLVSILMDVFLAGTETTASTLRFAVIFLLREPNWQVLLQKEVDQVVGNSRQPRVEDKYNMPLMEAFISETFRLSTVLPLGLFHVSLADSKLQGYNIPKGTVLIANLDYISKSEENFENPENFDPWRFIDEDGKYVKNPALVPFSLGRRSCLGENLSRTEIFLFLATFLQNFNLKNPPGKDIPSAEKVLGVLTRSKPFTLLLEDRNNNKMEEKVP